MMWITLISFIEEEYEKGNIDQFDEVDIQLIQKKLEEERGNEE